MHARLALFINMIDLLFGNNSRIIDPLGGTLMASLFLAWWSSWIRKSKDRVYEKWKYMGYEHICSCVAIEGKLFYCFLDLLLFFVSLYDK